MAKTIPTDIEISRAAPCRPITEIAAMAGIQPDELEPLGDCKAKIKLSILDRIRPNPLGKYIDVTAITPLSLIHI